MSFLRPSWWDLDIDHVPLSGFEDCRPQGALNQMDLPGCYSVTTGRCGFESRRLVEESGGKDYESTRGS